MNIDSAALQFDGADPAPERMLPKLREDLQLLPASRQESGAPSWNVYDPVRHAFFRIGRLEFEILSRWHSATPKEIVEDINKTTPMTITTGQVIGVQRFLTLNQLLQQETGKGLAKRLESRQDGFFRIFVKDYLYRRIPLFRPDVFLEATLSYVSFFYKTFFWKLTGLVGLTGIYLASQQWQEFVQTFLYFFTPAGIIFFTLAIILVKLAHELAHAYTAKYFGLKVPVIGIALIIIWPLFYTDTTDAWRLTDKKQRVKIGAAGVLLELTIAAYATFFWNFFEPGTVKSTLFLLATATWLVSLSVNLNPFMRFDGYYLLSDLWDVSNLQPRAFALGRWYLRRALLGMADPGPEILSQKKQRLLIVYALATWVYRVIIFTAIALMVYHLAFKALGIFLFAVEIGWFIGLPILKELKSYWQMRQKVRLARLLTGISVVAIFVSAFLYPWHSYVYAPAVYHDRSMIRVYTPESSRLQTMSARKGQRVTQGELLFELQSPELDFLEQQAARQVEKLKLKLKRAGFAEEKAEYLQVTEQRLTAALTALAGFRERKKRLRITAPISGEIVELTDDLSIGQWLNSSLRLGLIVSTKQKTVEGYVRERDLDRITIGCHGIFYPDHTELPLVHGVVQWLDQTHTGTLDEPCLASVYGGELAVRRTPDNKLASEDTVYRFLLQPDDAVALPLLMLRGKVRLQGKPMSFFKRAWLACARIVIRESEF